MFTEGRGTTIMSVLALLVLVRWEIKVHRASLCMWTLYCRQRVGDAETLWSRQQLAIEAKIPHSRLRGVSTYQVFADRGVVVGFTVPPVLLPPFTTTIAANVSIGWVTVYMQPSIGIDYGIQVYLVVVSEVGIYSFAIPIPVLAA